MMLAQSSKAVAMIFLDDARLVAMNEFSSYRPQAPQQSGEATDRPKNKYDDEGVS